VGLNWIDQHQRCIGMGWDRMGEVTRKTLCW